MHDCLMGANDDVAQRHSRPRARAEPAAAPHQASSRKHADNAPSREQRFMQDITQDFSSSLQRHSSQPFLENTGSPASILGSQSPQKIATRGKPSQEPCGSAILTEHWRDRILTIPEIRSALVAPDEMDDGHDWSSAFSLPKADLEPWLSFFKGYKESRLFAGPARPVRAESPGQPPALQLQFEVLAILALRSMGTRVILEPPVQISRPAEYLDLIAELEACSDPMQAQGRAKTANEVHECLLEQATVKGREMGERLYHALVGPDYTNLSREWNKLHQRKPSIDEMCCMLTTGRITLLPARRLPASAARPHRDKPCVPDTQIHVEKQREAPDVPEVLGKPALAKPPEQSETRKAVALARKIVEGTGQNHNRKRKVLLHLFQFTVCCAALVTHALAV